MCFKLNIQWHRQAKNGCFLLQQVCIFCLDSNEHWRAIWSKKSPCEGWLRFLVGQKRSSSRLVILKSRPMSPPARVVHTFSPLVILWKCRYRAHVYWNLSYPLLSILKVIFLESNPLRFIETLISFIRGFVYCLYMPGLK